MFDQIVNLEVDNNAVNLKSAVDFKKEWFTTNLSESANIHLFEEIYEPISNKMISPKESLITALYIIRTRSLFESIR